MPSKSKTKGNTFEREVAAHLSEVFGYNFERVPNSGAFVGGKNNIRYDKLSKSQQLIYEGDILVPDELYHLKIECKNYKDFAFHHLFTDNKTLNDWIEQAWSDDKVWFLIFKITRRGAFACMHESHFKQFQSCLKSSNYVKYKDCYIVTYDNFFETIKHKLISMQDETDKLL